MLKKVLMTVAAASSVLALAGCGGSSGGEFEIFLYQENTVYNADMPVFQRANEYAGITLEGVLQKYDTNYDNKYVLSGKYADIVVNDQDTIESTALDEGIFADLTDLITEENAPNLYKYFQENPEQKAWATASDGKIYGIPFYTEGQTAKGYFIRMDWVRKLDEAGKLPKGLEATTESLNNMKVAQLEELLLAFLDNASLISEDPQNVIPYFDRDVDFAISELASLWGATADYYIDDAGKVHYGVIEDSFKDAMNNMIRWFREGLIDDRIFANNNNEDYRVTLFAQDVGGMTHDWIGTTYSFNSDVYASNLVEDFELVCILPPIREDGTRVEPTTRKLIGNVTAISNDLSDEDKLTLLKWIDFFFSEEGQDLQNFGVEGEDYNIVDGEYVYTDNILNDNNTALQNLYNRGCQLQNAGVQNFAYEEAWLDPAAAQAMKDYEPYLNQHYNDLIYPNAKLTRDDYKAVNTAKSAIAAIYETQVAQWLQGKNEISDAAWNQFKASIQSNVDIVLNVLQARVDAGDL